MIDNSQMKITTDHEEIRAFIEGNNGKPATVRGTPRGRERAGILRVKYDQEDQMLISISWEDFFKKFDQANLALIYSTKPGSLWSRFMPRPAAGKEALCQESRSK